MSIWLCISILSWLPFMSDEAQHDHRVTYLPGNVAVTSGMQKIEVLFEVEEGFHIQSDSPSSDNLIPTVLKIEGGRDVRVVGVIFPEAHSISLTGSDDVLEVFDGKLSLTLILEFLASEPVSLPGQLCYQACDNRKCYFPQCLDFIIALDPKVHR